MQNRESLVEAARIIKGLGFRVFLANHPTSLWGFYSDGKHVGYFQMCEWAPGIETAIVNRTSNIGAMHMLTRQHGEATPLPEVTVETLQEAFKDYPDYFTKEDRESMQCYKYHSLDEFLSSSQAKDISEYL